MRVLPDEKGWQMRRFIRRLPGTITAGIQAALILNPLLVAQAVAQGTNENGSETVPDLKHVSIWTSPTPAPDNALVALLMSAVRLAAYCEPVSLQPQFRTDITCYEAEFPGDVDLNVLAEATLPDALIELSLTTASGDALPFTTADGDAFRSCVFQLNRLSPDPDAVGDPECPEPQLDALLDAVAEMESGVAQ